MEYSEQSLSSINHELLHQILDMTERDQKARWKWVETRDSSLDVEINAIDEIHFETLKEILRIYGWPGHRLVGEEGSHAYWLLVQHADKHIDFQREALKQLELAVKRNDADKSDLAYLTDRVLKNEHKAQIFGTQWSENGPYKVSLWPVQDLDRLNQLRLSMGLNSFEAYRQQMIEVFHLLEDEIENPFNI